MRLHKRQSWKRAGIPPTAVNLLAKVNDHQTRRTLAFLIITPEELCLNTTSLQDILSQAKEH